MESPVGMIITASARRCNRHFQRHPPSFGRSTHLQQNDFPTLTRLRGASTGAPTPTLTTSGIRPDTYASASSSSINFITSQTRSLLKSVKDRVKHFIQKLVEQRLYLDILSIEPIGSITDGFVQLVAEKLDRTSRC